MIRELLFEWFCSLRGAVKGRFPRKALLSQAEQLRDDYIAECLRAGMRADPPALGRAWLLRWRREYNVSLRFPNRRGKVSRPVLKDRLRIVWVIMIRVRTLC